MRCNFHLGHFWRQHFGNVTEKLELCNGEDVISLDTIVKVVIYFVIIILNLPQIVRTLLNKDNLPKLPFT